MGIYTAVHQEQLNKFLTKAGIAADAPLAAMPDLSHVPTDDYVIRPLNTANELFAMGERMENGIVWYAERVFQGREHLYAVTRADAAADELPLANLSVHCQTGRLLVIQGPRNAAVAPQVAEWVRTVALPALYRPETPRRPRSR